MKGVLIITFLTGYACISCVRNDEKIENRVEKKILAEDSTLKTESKNGVVTISGKVENDAVNTEIANKASKVSGVKGVLINTTVEEGKIIVKPDDEILKYIETALNERYITGVKVRVSNGVATLYGEAKRKDLRNISFIAEGAGARKVINELELK